MSYAFKSSFSFGFPSLDEAKKERIAQKSEEKKQKFSPINVDHVLDADTFMLKAAYGMGDMGTIIARGTQTTAGKSNLKGSETDFTDLELIYKIKTGGVNYLLAYVNTNKDYKLAADKDVNTDIIRIWARYNF